MVNGYPKSGTTWVTQLIAHVLDLSYQKRHVRFRFNGVALHTHSISFEGQDRLLYVVRDPREVVCSAARVNAAKNWGDVFDANGHITESFVRHALFEFPGARATMPDHLSKCIDAGWEHVRFEDLKSHPVQTLSRILVHFGVNPSGAEPALKEFEFSAQKKQQPKDTSLSQSSLDSWRSLLTAGSLETIRNACGDQAAKFDYDLSGD